ncbi:MAG: polysaccharide biosynthesis protein [Nitrososphaeria archaeon]|nr:polysaccharide biosynthesis protein [Nitrososphaeria archaeon]NDB89017.1 polysaccharide biosynthesis protein [Nitrososphaerota archaeon]NDB91040.1 polysaccharide biosynthesis protein [Nitrososphaerota archaeon]NDF29937.1 polysaccharide biosynthesis protein [Nitrososphaeria archaeon]
MFDGKTVLITGGTGSLGQALTRRLLTTKVRTVRVFSRNENKQVMMESEIHDKRLRFLIGDIRDKERLITALDGVDIVFHAAALKHVPVIEYNPFESIKTNVIGSQNVIDACLHQNVGTAVCIGTDKAVSPLNTYGATKLLMEKLFVTANNYLNHKKYRTRFLAVRYGNVVGSSGSVIPRFIEQIKAKKKITITNPKMTRFSITMNQALDLIIDTALNGKESEIYIPKLKAYSITDVKDTLFDLLGNTGEKVIGIRSGEKLHETLINNEEMRSSWDLGKYYMIANPLRDENDVKKSYSQKIKKISNVESYSSDSVAKMTKSELKKTIIESGLLDTET